MAGSVQRGMRAFVTVHRAGDCDGAGIAELLAEAGRSVGSLGSVWVRHVSLEVDHHAGSAEVALTISYDHAMARDQVGDAVAVRGATDEPARRG